MTKPTRTEVNCTTGETSIIELTDAEIKAMEDAAVQFEADRKAEAADAAKKLADKEAIAAKLGLSSAELQALLS
ncbi:hypothetical protein UFOVP1255_5 [uncultured Caudovirales phage]|uniref:Uncharacterized protein n=1 Tax=uncultured Caudovirales phage TaxID=2100421 RepID=A0A6J5RIG9_9CAUD|nr:hypothetical protein UFOVP973_25 [uncultured Caudovirales phage]CAB4194027.1 hypothetical protein UFOVP1255_5 [uncultured Caudovirales phage]CAB4216898.1 hypothetical protein UFOVP1496_18 [uncultured Caudovirales phage]